MKPFWPRRHIIGAFGLGFISALVSVYLWSTVIPESALTTGLPSDWQLASAQFDARVRNQFPVGTSLQTLAERLDKEGFRPAWSDDQGGYEEYIAERVTADLGCTHSARVRWRLSEQGTVSSIRGLHRETCL